MLAAKKYMQDTDVLAIPLPSAYSRVLRLHRIFYPRPDDGEDSNRKFQ